jgi:DNA repair exonuclease SbcCD ATPase subunit
MLKAWTKSVQQKAVEKREYLDKLEEVLKEEQVIIGRLNQRTRELLEQAKEAHAAADAHVSTYAKLQEDLDRCVDVVSQREQELQGKEEITGKHEHERNELTSCTDDLSAREATLEMERERLRKMYEDLCSHEFAISSQEGTLECRIIALTSKERKLANKEKWLAEKEFQELATMHRTVEELQAARQVEAQKVWDFLGQTEMALAPLSFSPIRSREPGREVSNVLPVLDPMGAKMLTLEEVVSEQLEDEGHILAEKVAEHVLTWFQS